MAGQSIGDRLVAAQHTILGSEIAKVVCKASTTETTPPKKKHLDYLLAMTNEPNINIPELANHLVDRTRQLKWVVVFKTLITTHHLMCNGNERFLQHLASRNGLFSLDSFLDRTGTQSYEMSSYLRRYATYLNQKAISYRLMAYDFTRIKRGKDGFVRSLNGDELLRALPILQQQLDCLIEFDTSSRSLNNGIIIAAFMLLFKDLIRLFACYNDGIINLLEKYFHMKKNQCKEAVDIYKKYIVRMNKVPEMLKVAEQVGVDKGDIPDLAPAPNSLLDSLEQHLAFLENKKSDHRQTAVAAHSQINALKHINSTLSKVDQNIPDLIFDEDKTDVDSAFPAVKSSFQESFLPRQESPQKSSAGQDDFLDIFSGGSSTATSPANNPFQQDTSDIFGTFQTTPAVSPQLFQPSSQSPTYNVGMQSTSPRPPMFTASPPPQPQIDLFNLPQSSNAFGAIPAGGSAFDEVFPSSDLMQPLTTDRSSLFNQQPVKDSAKGASANSAISLESSFADLQLSLKAGKQKANQDFQPKEKKLTGGSCFNPTSLTSLSTIGSSTMQPMGMSSDAQQSAMFNAASMPGQSMVSPQQIQQSQVGMLFQQPYPQAPQNRSLSPNNPFL